MIRFSWQPRSRKLAITALALVLFGEAAPAQQEPTFRTQSNVVLVPALSPQHYRLTLERTPGSLVKLIDGLAASDPARLQAFRAEFDAAAEPYIRDNVVRQDYLLTRAKKI